MNRGFTLIELMICIAIVALLVALFAGSCAPKPGEEGYVCDKNCQALKVSCSPEQFDLIEREAQLCQKLQGKFCTAEAKLKICADQRY